jgi:hypothetical protein
MTATRRCTWVFKMDKVVEVGMTEDRERCTKLFARIVKKNVKSHLSLEKTVRFIARTVLQSIKKAADLYCSRLARIKKPVRPIPAGFFITFVLITDTRRSSVVMPDTHSCSEIFPTHKI